MIVIMLILAVSIVDHKVDLILSQCSFLIDCKVSRNPYSLFRGSEYQRAAKELGQDPLTYYDMNLSAQDHQTFFTCDADAGKPEYECKDFGCYFITENFSNAVSMA